MAKGTGGGHNMYSGSFKGQPNETGSGKVLFDGPLEGGSYL